MNAGVGVLTLFFFGQKIKIRTCGGVGGECLVMMKGYPRIFGVLFIVVG